MLMYADNTILSCNVNQTLNDTVINGELNKITDWFNKLSLNVKKTKCMVFHTAQRKVTYPSLKINNVSIEQVNQFNFLGLILNSNLSFTAHTQHISLKISRIIGLMYRLKHIYPQSVLLLLYNTLVVSHFNYCLLIWGSKITNGHSLHKLQKKALRIINNCDYVAHTEPICKTLSLLKVTDMFVIAMWKFFFKLMNNTLPSYFDIMKPELPRVCNYHEIRRPVFHIPPIKHQFAELLVKVQLIRLLNSERSVMRITSKVHTHSFIGFKLFIKNIIIDNYKDYCDIINCYSCNRQDSE